MREHRKYDEHSSSCEYDFEGEENPETLHHKKEVRRMLELRLDRKRLREELADDFSDELDDEFDWGDIEK